jgi:hypothetical protein
MSTQRKYAEKQDRRGPFTHGIRDGGHECIEGVSLRRLLELGLLAAGRGHLRLIRPHEGVQGVLLLLLLPPPGRRRPLLVGAHERVERVLVVIVKPPRWRRPRVVIVVIVEVVLWTEGEGVVRLGVTRGSESGYVARDALSDCDRERRSNHASALTTLDHRRQIYTIIDSSSLTFMALSRERALAM